MLARAHAAPVLPAVSVQVEPGTAPALRVDGTVLAPYMFAANNQYGRDDTLQAEIAQAEAAGYPIYTINLPAPLPKDPGAVVEAVQKFTTAHPRAYVLARAWLGADDAWRTAHPEELLRDDQGATIGYVSPASEAWRAEVGQRLGDALQAIGRSDCAPRFLGVMLTYLNTGEWFYPETDRYWDYSAPSKAAFRSWLTRRYKEDAALRVAWGEEAVTLATAEIPTPAQREAVAWGPFRASAAGRDYARFTAEFMAETITHFAAIAKPASDRLMLVGTFYGYSFELNHNGPRALQHSGHLALARVLANPDIDFVAAPYSYLERGMGEPGHLHFPVESIALHRKLAMIEDDTFTDRSILPKGAAEPGNNARAKTPEETILLARRNFGNALAHGAGLWWFDIYSEGRWGAESFWKSTTVLRDAADSVSRVTAEAPPVAVIVDEEAIAALRDTGNPPLEQALGFARAEFDRLGTPVGYYLQSDLEQIPSATRVFYFATPFDLSAEVRAEIAKRIARGATVVFGWMLQQGGTAAFAPERIEHLAGFGASLAPADTPRRIVDAGGDALDIPEGIPLLAIQAKADEALARFGDSGRVACAMRAMGAGHIVLGGAPRLCGGTWRRICAESGVPLLTDRPAGVAVAGNFIFVTPSPNPEGTCRIVPPPGRRFVQRLGVGDVWIEIQEAERAAQAVPSGETTLLRTSAQ